MNGMFKSKNFNKFLIIILLAYALGREAIMFGIGNGSP